MPMSVPTSGAGAGIDFGGDQADTVLTAGTTRYLNKLGTSQATERLAIAWVAYANGTIDRLEAIVEGSAAGTLTITVRKNGVDTALTTGAVAGPGAGVNGRISDLTHSFSVLAGDYLTVQTVAATQNASVKRCTARFTPT